MSEPQTREEILGEVRDTVQKVHDHPHNTKYAQDALRAFARLAKVDQDRIETLEEVLVHLRVDGVPAEQISRAITKANITVHIR